MKNNLLSIDEYRNNPEFYFYKGLRCANKKNLNDAYKNLVKASRLNPENCEYKFNIACFLSEMQRPKEANRIFSDILLHYDPTMYDCFFGMGCNCFELGDITKAAEYFEKYIYFDNEGEFSEEVSEMIFYLKLYNDISAENKFLKLSKASLKKAEKSVIENRINDAVRELYRSISYNPMNIDARNLLMLVMLEQQNYRRASSISSTVMCIYNDDIWANCLAIYNLYHARKYSRVEKFLKILPYRRINSREDLLCVVTTLIIFNKIEELILMLESYIVEYSDLFIYSILLLGYIYTRRNDKAIEIMDILFGMEISSMRLPEWLSKCRSIINGEKQEISVLAEYQGIFGIMGEPEDYMYSPERYIKIYEGGPKPKSKLSKKYNSIIECAVEHREIMYTPNYEKEIIHLLSNMIKQMEQPVSYIEEETAALSAALEFIYCRERFIDMDKEELRQKYNITTILINKALKKLSFD